MGKIYESIDSTVREFIERQQMFFVATAPLEQNGHVNVSPKGLDSLRILDEQTVVYADLYGSGIETVAHLKQNGRIVLMFCAFEGAPKIFRLHGRGEVLEPESAEFSDYAQDFPSLHGVRSIIRVRCTRICDSCGFGVPLYEFQNQRSQLTDWATNKTPEQIQAYKRQKNAHSIDGLLGI